MKKMLIVLLAFTGCMGSQESDNITAEQMDSVVIAEGNRIATLAQEALSGQLKKAIAEGGIPHAITFCNLSAYSIMDTLTTGRKATIKRASLRLRNPQDAPTQTEREILEEYRAVLDNNEELHPIVKDPDERHILYAQPIMMNNPLCLNCHGTVGEQVSQETYDLIQSLYPEDNAAGHALGDLRGIWSITFSQEDIKDSLKQQLESDSNGNAG